MNHLLSQPILLCLLTLVGLCLRLAYLPSDDVWWDEVVTATRAMLPLDALLTSLKYQGPSPVSTDCAPPLHHIIIHYSLLLGRTDFFLKLPNALFGTMTIPAVYYLARRLLNNRAAWYAAIFICFSSFHVSYSRDARWYSLFFFSSVCAFYFFLAALEDGRARNWLKFVFFATAMNYTSYTSAVYLAAMGACFAPWLLLSGPGALPGRRKHAAIGFALSLLAVLVLYSPWVMAQANAYFAFYQPNISRPFSLGILAGYFRAFIAPHYFNPPFLGATAVAIVLGGIATMLAGKRYFQLTSLMLWTFIPVVAAYKAKIAFDISPRYIISVLLFMSCMTAASADGLGQLASHALRRGKAACSVAVGLTLILTVSSLSFRFYPGHFLDGYDSYKPSLSWLSTNKLNAEYLLYAKSRQHKAIVDWYLPGLYRGLESDTGVGYKRCVVITGRSRSQVPQPGETHFDDFFFTRLGLVNRSPLVIDPRAGNIFNYDADFSGFQTYQDASSIDNVCVFTDFRDLALYDLTKPGTISYSFTAPPTCTPRVLTTRLTLVLDRAQFIEPDCSFSMIVRDTDGKEYPLIAKTASDFPQGVVTLDCEASLNLDSLPPGPFHVVLAFADGKRAGIMSVKDLNFKIQTDSPSVPDDFDAADQYARHIASNSNIQTAWSPDVVRPSHPAPYAFDLGSAQGREQLRHYLAAHPESRPVYVLKGNDGSVRWEYHDPWLLSPSIQLNEGQGDTTIALAPGTSLPLFSSYMLSGRMVFPTLRTQQHEWPLLLNTPPGTVAAINAGSKGRLSLRPMFTPQLFTPESIDHYDGIATLDGQDCLTCSSGSDCSFSYSFQSIFPMESIRVVWHPRLFSDTAGKNTVKLLVSQDGAPPQEIGRFDGKRTGGWDGPDRHVANYTFPKPATKVDITFRLTGDSTQVWSKPSLPLVIEAVIDCRKAPALTLSPSSRLSAVGNEGNNLGLFLSPSPIIFNDHVEFWH